MESRLFAFPPIKGELSVSSVAVSDSVFRLTIRIGNLSEDLEDRSMLSVHTLLGIERGQFLSLLDPPEEYKIATAACRNIGTWPVLAGREGDRHLMLSSPIILYDYPKIAPESAGDLFDSTEIDEILTLRVLTLSDDEKKELSSGDDRVRRILERTESLPPQALAKLHGAIRGLRSASKLNFREGDRVLSTEKSPSLNQSKAISKTTYILPSLWKMTPAATSAKPVRLATASFSAPTKWNCYENSRRLHWQYIPRRRCIWLRSRQISY
jgi:hypothetical protein